MCHFPGLGHEFLRCLPPAKPDGQQKPCHATSAVLSLHHQPRHPLYLALATQSAPLACDTSSLLDTVVQAAEMTQPPGLEPFTHTSPLTRMKWKKKWPQHLKSGLNLLHSLPSCPAGSRGGHMHVHRALWSTSWDPAPGSTPLGVSLRISTHGETEFVCDL